MGPTVARLRVSAITTELIPALLDHARFPPGNPDEYQKTFERAQRGITERRGLTFQLPWAPRDFSWFWRYWLEAEGYESISSSHALRAQVPFRIRHGLEIREIDRMPDGVRARLEVFAFPYGLSALVTTDFVSDQGMSLNEVVAVVGNTQHSQFRLVGKHAHGTAQLRRIGTVALRAVRRSIHKRLDVGMSLGDPAIVATIITGDPAEWTGPLQANGEIHHALDALCRLEPDWEVIKPAPLAKALAPMGESRTDPTSEREVVYVRDRSVVLWFPDLFRVPAGRRTTRRLSCYHRNQTLLAMHCDIFLTLVRWAAERRSAGRPLRQLEAKLARDAAQILARLYVGSKRTYCSRLSVVHIDRSDLNDAIATLKASPGQAATPLVHKLRAPSA